LNPNFDILLPSPKLKPHLPKPTNPDFLFLAAATATAAAGHSATRVIVVAARFFDIIKVSF
jgi:hypothetical protein